MFTEKQFTRLAELYMDTVFRLAFNYTKSKAEADDITQDVLIKLYRTDKAFESEAHIKHWLIRVTINECKKAFLSPWKRVEPLEEYASTISLRKTSGSVEPEVFSVKRQCSSRPMPATGGCCKKERPHRRSFFFTRGKVTWP